MLFYSLKKKIQLQHGGYQFPLKHAVLSSLAINLLSLAIPILTLQIYDRILKTGHSGTLYVLCSGVALAIVIEVALRIIQSYNMIFSGCVFEHFLTIQFIDQFLTKKKANDKEHDMGAFLNKLSAISKLKELHSGQSVSDMIDMPFLILFLSLIWFFASWLILVPVCILLIIVSNTAFIWKKTKRSISIHEKSQKKRYGFIIETLLGIHSVKSCGWEESFTRQFENFQSDATLSNYNMASLSTLIYDEGISASQLTTILMATTGAPWVLQGSLSVGSLTACVMLAGRIMQMVQKMMGLSIRLADLTQAYTEIKPYLQIEHAHPPFCVLEQTGTLVFDHVTLEKNKKDFLIGDLSFELGSGHSILIDSDNQEINHALIQLICGQIAPSSGEIWVNGIRPFDIDLNELASQIAYLPMQGQLFKGTIEENISRFGKIPKSRVYELAEELQIAKEINKLSAGFDTEIAGINLGFISPGVRQRIALCRALAENPKIVVFDNLEYSLDTEGYKIFMDFLNKKYTELTTVFFSKDPNIRKFTSHVLTFKKSNWEMIENRTRKEAT